MSLRAVPSVIGLVVLCAALCGAVPVSRADAPPEPAPFAGSYADWQALVPPGDAPDGLSVHVLLEEYAVTFDADGRRTMRWRLVFQPLTKAQVDAWGTVSEEWGLWYQERPELRGRVLAPDGSVHEIDPATIGERPAERDERVLDDRRVVEAPLPGLVTGAIVEQQTTVRDRVPFFDRGMARRVSFGRGVPVRRVRVVLDRPAAMPFRVGVRRFDAQPVERVEGGRAITTLEAGPLVGNADPELNLTYVESIVPSVWFSNGTSWGEVAARYGEIVDRRAAGELPAALRKAVAEPGTPRERAQRALDWVHGNVRYTGIEFGESAIEPRPPAETARTKFGDCKDQATLLVAALRSVKLDARVALLAPGRGPDVEPDFPGLGGFDHAIVYVGGASPFWIDPTDPFSRAGELPLADAGRLALVTGAGTTALTPTPSPSVEDSRETSRRSVTLQFGKGRVAETIEGSGWIEHALRGWIDGRSPDDRTKLLEAYVQDAFRADVLKSGESGDPRSFAKPMTVTTESADVRSALVDETEGAVAFSLRPLFEYAPEALRTAPPEKPVPLRAWQRRPEVTAYRVAQHAKEWVWDIVPPRGFVVRELPAGAVDEVPGMRLVREYATTPEGHVRARLRFELRQERLLPAEARAIRDAIVKYAQETVVLSFDHEGYRHLGAGRIKEAIASFRRLVADDAKDTRAHCGLAQAYLQGGMGEFARREIDAAIATAPGFATAHRVRGWILEHDLIGRRFAKGFDYDGAVAAYRKAEELDPTDLVARVSRAILLEHDHHGRRYTAEARLDDAIAAYRAPAGQQNTTQVKINQAFAECYAGRFKDARETLLSVPAAERPQELRLAIDATADLAKTLAEIRREQDPQKRANLAHQAAMHLVRFRQYAPAAELMSEAGRGVPEASARLGLADLLRRTTPRAPTKLDAPDMAEFMRHAVQQLLSMDVERIAPLFPPELGEDLNAERGFRSMGADLAVAEQAFGY